MKNDTTRSLLLGALLLGAGALPAQQYSDGWSVVASGGGASTGPNYTLSGTIGQWDAGGPATGGRYSLTGGFWERPGGPQLTIQRASRTTVLVSWPAPALGCFVLQETSSLSSPDWVDVPNAVTFVNGASQVVLSSTSHAQFYRLVSLCR